MANEVEFLSPLPDKALLFRRMHAREVLGRLPEYSVELLRPSNLKPIEPKELLGLRATVQIEVEEGVFRYVNGVVTQFEQGGATGRFDVYRVELRPWLFHLTLGADCRIFQDRTALQIIEEVFGEYAPAPVEKKLSGEFRKRPYTVQYRESDFNFVSRLMEEEGVYHYFRHEKSQHTMVLCNSPSGHSPLAAGKLYWAARQTDNLLRDNLVTHWSRATTLRSAKFTHLDYAADAPTADLKGEATRSPPYPKPNDLEVFDYPGGYEDLAMDLTTAVKQQEATRLAKLRVDAFESGHIVAAGVTPYRLMAAGGTFTFVDHANAGGYLVTQADYSMEYSGYEANPDTVGNSFTCRFEAVPKEINYQPPAVAVKPLVNGPQTATVVGPSGDEIHTDKHGRVRLHFHWDRVGTRNEKSACWARVSHASAGKNFGSISLPRIGEEVVVEFLEGNPDRPLVTGRVYNGDNLAPWELPKRAAVSGFITRSTKGGAQANANELRADDTKGSEYIWMTAEKDYYQEVKNDSSTFVNHNLYSTVAKMAQYVVNETLWVKVGKESRFDNEGDSFSRIAGDHTGAVEGAFGLKVTGAMALKAENTLAVSTGADTDLAVGAALKVTATAAIGIKGLGIVIDGGTQVTLKAGGSFITLGPDGVSIQGAMVKINSGGSAGAAQAATRAAPPAPKKPDAIPEKSDPIRK